MNLSVILIGIENILKARNCLDFEVDLSQYTS